MEKKEFIVLPKSGVASIDYHKLAEEVSYVIVPIQDGLEHETHAEKEIIQGLKSVGLPFGVSATFNSTEEHDARDEAVRYYKRAEGLGIENQQWFFVEVEAETMPTMRNGVNHFVRVLRENGVECVGLRIKKNVMKKAMLDLNMFDVVDAIEPNEEAHHIENHLFHNPGMHEFTEDSHVSALPVHVAEGHCENGFNIYSLVNARVCDAFYKKAPYEVKVLETISFYEDAELTKEKGTYETGQLLQLKGIHSCEGHCAALETKEGTWVLADRNLLASTYYQCECLVGKEIEAKVPVTVYSAAEFDDQNRMDEYHVGKQLKIVGLAHAHSGEPRFEINEKKDGHPLYVTASKEVFTVLDK